MMTAKEEAEMQEGWDESKMSEKLCMHCRICRSSFLGYGETKEEAFKMAYRGLIDHASMWHSKPIDRQVEAVFKKEEV